MQGVLQDGRGVQDTWGWAVEFQTRGEIITGLLHASLELPGTSFLPVGGAGQCHLCRATEVGCSISRRGLKASSSRLDRALVAFR